MDRIHKIRKICARLCVKLNNRPHPEDTGKDFSTDSTDIEAKNYLPQESKVV